MTHYRGQCLCGAVTLAINSHPLAVTRCHCAHCKRQSGSLFSINLIMRERDVEATGKTQLFKDIGDSGKPVLRHFCPGCGSPLFVRAESMPGLIVVKAGVISDLEALRPTLEIYTAQAPGWLSLSEEANHFPHAPN